MYIYSTLQIVCGVQWKGSKKKVFFSHLGTERSITPSRMHAQVSHHMHAQHAHTYTRNNIP